MPEASGRRPHVLVVEDNDANLELAEFLLSEAGVGVTALRDAASVSRALRDRAGPLPDLVLMDVQLPGRDGTSLMRELRASPGWGLVPVVAFTAQAMRGDRERLLAAGFSGYIPKPIAVASFVASVLSHLPGEVQP